MLKQTMKIYKSFEYGSIEGVINNRVVTLLSLYIKLQYRGKGYGTLLLLDFLQESYKNNAIHITLDDCSDNYRKKNNIYVKYGLKYIYNNNTMIGNIRNIINNIYK